MKERKRNVFKRRLLEIRNRIRNALPKVYKTIQQKLKDTKNKHTYVKYNKKLGPRNDGRISVYNKRMLDEAVRKQTEKNKQKTNNPCMNHNGATVVKGDKCKYPAGRCGYKDECCSCCGSSCSVKKEMNKSKTPSPLKKSSTKKSTPKSSKTMSSLRNSNYKNTFSSSTKVQNPRDTKYIESVLKKMNKPKRKSSPSKTGPQLLFLSTLPTQNGKFRNHEFKIGEQFNVSKFKK